MNKKQFEKVRSFLKKIREDKQQFKKLKSYIEKTRIGEKVKNRLFSLCIKASLSKCYEFNMLVRNQSDSTDAFFWLPALRGICEDLIILNFIKGLPHHDREKLIGSLMMHEVCTRVECQKSFFKENRPQQSVLGIQGGPTEIRNLETIIQAIWNSHGWPNLRHGVMPKVRQIAGRQGKHVLINLYDYLYRLTSGSVHFNVQSLLRSGWGESTRKMTFTPKNFHHYYSIYAQFYGAFLFCIYFEFFGKFLVPGKAVSEIVSQIRKSLWLQQRWPEMVTFEEMNLKPPKENVLKDALSVMQALERKRIIPKS